MRYPFLVFLMLVLTPGALCNELELDDGPRKAGEWGFHPLEDAALPLTPPGFAWRLQKKAHAYELMVNGPGGKMHFQGLKLNVFCPPRPLEPGSYTWKYRYGDQGGNLSAWSRERAFTIPADASVFPLPEREELMERIPKEHPRLFVRPGEIPALRAAAFGERKAEFGEILEQCDKLLANLPSTEEPPKYPKGTVRKSEAWRAIWWGNRVSTIRVLESAATLAFAGLVAEKTDYLEAAKRLLLDAATWDPEGATGYRYNDEAGMPYAYHFSRAYTFLHDYLTEEERAACRKVMARRGAAMYKHLCPRHLFNPYSSHSNRAWHFLGEVGIAFHDEIPGAEDWIWFAVNVFRCVYPVWCDDDGGWHEGMSYWLSYVGRFTWWADVMKAAMGLDAYKIPYFSKVGNYPLYLMPPGKEGGGFGDLCGRKTSKNAVPLMAVFATQAGNPYWQWYVEAHGPPPKQPGYIGYLRGRFSKVHPLPPDSLPCSRLFEGTGQAMLNSTLLNAADNVQVLFKSSPFGTQSHGYESQNAFLLNVFGERMLIRSGYRDIYGSAHHSDWMWETKSVNSITVNGKGQKKHTAVACGAITEFHAGKRIDYTAGEAGPAYGGILESFIRRILFIKPDLIVIFDTLEAQESSTYTWWLHAPFPMELDGQKRITLEGKKGAALVSFLAPENLKVQVTDRFDPPPRERIKLKQWHLTAALDAPARRTVFVTAIRPFSKGGRPPVPVSIEEHEGGYVLEAPTGSGQAIVLLRTSNGTLSSGGFESRSRMAAAILRDDARIETRFESTEVVN